MQILKHWKPFRDLKLTFTVSRRAEQFRLHTQEYIVVTVEDSVLRTEMVRLESQEELVFDRSFFVTTVGDKIPPLSELSLSACGCKKFVIDPLGDHVNTCTAHSGVKKATGGSESGSVMWGH